MKSFRKFKYTKKTIPTLFLIINTVVFVLLTPILIDLQKVNLTYLHNKKVVDTEKLIYEPLGNKVLIVDVKPRFDYLGRITLYFKPLRNPANFSDILKTNTRFRFQISVFDRKNNSYIFDAPVEVFHNQKQSFAYDIGIPTQHKSKNNDYQIMIRPLKYDNEYPHFMGIAKDDGKPIVTTYYYLSKDSLLANPFSSFSFIAQKITQLSYKYFFALLLFLMNSAILLGYANKTILTTNFSISFLILLVEPIAKFYPNHQISEIILATTKYSYFSLSLICFLILAWKNKGKFRLFSDDISKQFLSKKVFVFIISLILAYATFNRFYNLGITDIHHDEYWYTSSITTYIHSNSTNLWDYINNKPSETKYTPFLTIFVGEFVKLVGINEVSLRAPFAFFGIISIIIVSLLSYKITKSRLCALLSSYGLATNDLHIYLSRYIRQYSLFVLLLLIFSVIQVNQIDKRYSIVKDLIFPSILIIFIFLNLSDFAIMFFFHILLLNFIKIRRDKPKISIKHLLPITFGAIGLSLIFKNYIYEVFKILDRGFILGFDKYRFFDYTNWLFFDSWNINPVVIILLLFIFLIIGLKQKNHKYLLLISYVIIPYFFLNINTYHSHDNRYISYLLPFLIIILAISITIIIHSINKKVKNKIITIIITTPLILLLFPLQNPYHNSFLSPIMQGAWTKNEGSRISNRSVAPKYKIAYSYLYKITNNGDIVIISDGLNYLIPKNGVLYYGINPWNKTEKVYSFHNNDINFQTTTAKREELFFNILTDMPENNKLVWIGAYLHLISKDISKFLLTSCVNHGIYLGLPHYDYLEFYNNLVTTWPNIFICKNINYL